MALNDRLVSVVQAIGTDIKSLFSSLSGKQNTLVSGTNIKTLNGNSLLGSGDISAGGVSFGPVGELDLSAASSEPATPSSGVSIYAKEIVPGNTVLKVLRQSGIDSPVQDGIAFNRLVKYQGGPSTITAIGGGALTASTAGTTVIPASSARMFTVLPRTQYSTAATANAIVSLYSGATGMGTHMLRGGNDLQGGFRIVFRWVINSTVASQSRFFIGLRDVVSAPVSVDPLTSTSPGSIGVGFNLASSSSYKILHNLNGSAPTVVAGAISPSNAQDLMELVLFCPRNNSGAQPVSYRLRRFTTGDFVVSEVSGTLSTNLPAGATLLHPGAWIVNGPSAAAAASFQINGFTIESDF